MKITTLALIPVVALPLAGSGSSAHAEELATRTLATMDRVGADSQVGLDVAYTSFGDDEMFLDGLTTLRFDLHGRYVHSNGFGFAAALPLTRASEDDESETAIGNLSIAGLYAARRGSAELFVRAGVVLPTADDETGGVNLLGGYGRLGDVMTGVPEATTLQLSASPQVTHRAFFARADLGVDVVIDKPEEVGDFGPFAHLSGAVGVDTGPVDLAVELVNEFNLGDEGEDDPNIHTLGFTACYSEAPVRPHLGVALPVGDTLGNFVDFIVLGGVSGTFGR
jgi:hypothetical protein